jgi:hypothetical protein
MLAARGSTMKNHPKSSRDKSRSAQDKKQAREIVASEQGSAAKRVAVAAPKPESVAAKREAVAPKREQVTPKPKEAAPKPEAVGPKREDAPKAKDLAAKPKQVAAELKPGAAKPKAAVPERKETAPQHEDVAHKRKDVAAKAPAPTQVAVLEIRSAPSGPAAASPQPSLDEGASAIEWPFEAAGQSALAMNRKLIEIAQANVTSSFDLARNLAGAKSPVEMMQLQMCYWQERISALAGQAEELRALSAELVASASEPIKAHMRWTLAA